MVLGIVGGTLGAIPGKLGSWLVGYVADICPGCENGKGMVGMLIGGGTDGKDTGVWLCLWARGCAGGIL